MKKLTHILATLILTSLTATAEPDHSHDKVVIPATLTELWTAIQTEQAALTTALETRNGDASHGSIDKLTAYANALPEKVTGLDETKMQRIAGQAKNLAKVYDDIHHAADEAEFAKASKDAGKAASVLKLLESQLPLEP